MNKYPRTGSIEKRPKNTSAKCGVCGALAKRRVEIQVSFFRGDDEVKWLCATCHPRDLMQAKEPKP